MKLRVITPYTKINSELMREVGEAEIIEGLNNQSMNVWKYCNETNKKFLKTNIPKM
jgi:hypothetical protein